MADPQHNQSHVRTYAKDVAALTGKPLPKGMRNDHAPLPPKPEPPPAEIIPKAPSTNESREEVLKRLRERVATGVSTAAPQVPASEPSREAVLTRLKEAAPKTPERLHTYKSDFANKAKEGGATRISMIAAESDATPTSVSLPEKKRPNVFAFVAGALLLIAGIGSVYAAYRFATGEPPIPQETIIPSLVFADERIELSGEGRALQDALASSGRNLGNREVAVTYLTYATTTEAGTVETVATGAALFEALALPAPPILKRNVEAPTTVGVIRTDEEVRPFFLLRVSSFERTFAGMLEWEGTMEADLLLLYPRFETDPVGTTSASTTKPFRLSFIDEVVENHDVRILRDIEGTSQILYGYYDKETLVIARNEAAFRELVSRLSATGR